MNKLKKMKENIKGFTLVEIIVVLLILAIMAAIAIPSMLGYVQEARNSEYIAEARTGYVAAQTVATQRAASSDATLSSDAAVKAYIEDATNLEKINKFIGTDTMIKDISAATVTKGRVTKITVTLTNDKIVEFNGSEAVVK